MKNEHTDIDELKETYGIFYKYDWKTHRWQCKLNDDVIFTIGDEYVVEHMVEKGYKTELEAFADMSKSTIVHQISENSNRFLVRTMMKELFNLPLDKNPKL